MVNMHGVIVPMTTPFLENGSVDYTTLSATTKFLISNGIKYLYPCGTTGEMHFLSAEERKHISETVNPKRIVLASLQASVLLQHRKPLLDAIGTGA